MEKEFVPGEPQKYKIDDKHTFIVEPYYRKDGESMWDILLKMMMADVNEKLWNESHGQKI